ncbi:MAG: hypothetical protein WC628_02070 [Candidatus Omnitrophota bacterium]
MIFKWESDEEKLKRFMRIPAKKKLEWLNQMHEFMRLAYSKKQRDIFGK